MDQPVSVQQNALHIHTMGLAGNIPILALRARRTKQAEKTMLPTLRSADIPTNSGHRTR